MMTMSTLASKNNFLTLSRSTSRVPTAAPTINRPLLSNDGSAVLG